MSMSVRLDDPMERALEQIAKRKGQSTSEVARKAIQDLIAREERIPYELVSDLIGSVSGGPEDLSEHTGHRFQELLQRRKAG
jgi:Arc/MetJ-type ribon-helix-helix transcriptional regulator